MDNFNEHLEEDKEASREFVKPQDEPNLREMADRVLKNIHRDEIQTLHGSVIDAMIEFAQRVSARARAEAMEKRERIHEMHREVKKHKDEIRAYQLELKECRDQKDPRTDELRRHVAKLSTENTRLNEERERREQEWRIEIDKLTARIAELEKEKAEASSMEISYFDERGVQCVRNVRVPVNVDAERIAKLQAREIELMHECAMTNSRLSNHQETIKNMAKKIDDLVAENRELRTGGRAAAECMEAFFDRHKNLQRVIGQHDKQEARIKKLAETIVSLISESKSDTNGKL